MATTDPLFHRAEYARELAEQLLKPGPLHAQVRSGVFLSGIRRVGKTTFLRQDLIPALESRGALVIYVDLWSDRAKSPAALVHEAVRAMLRELQTPGSGLLQRLNGLNIGAAGLSFGFQIDSLGDRGGATLAQAFEELVARARRDVVLIVDEVQQALTSEDGYNMLHAVKAARDAVNARPDMPGHLLFIGTGSHKSLITDMATRRSQPFTGAVAAPYELLGKDFVQWQLERVACASGKVVLPSLEVAWQGFQQVGHRPEELLKALVQLQTAPAPPDQAFPIICATLAAAAADVELRAVDEMGELGRAVFARIAAGKDDGVTGLFGAEALAQYARRTGSPVEAPQVQNVIDRLIAANLVLRLGHGQYAVADPFVRQAWRQREALLTPSAAAAPP